MCHQQKPHRAGIGPLVALVFLFAGALAHGATFYCDPAQGRPEGDGSAARPWRTFQEVLAARLIQLRDPAGRPANPNAPVKPGDTVLLRSGWHGVIVIPRGYNDQFITIAAEKGHAPQVGWIEIGEGRKWLVKGLTVSPSLAPAPLGKLPVGHLVAMGERGGEDSAELVVEDCFIYSVLETSAWTAKDWVAKPANGIWLGRHGKGHIARNNYVLNTRFGINLCAPDCLCEGNVVANFSGDGIRATRDGQTVQYNVIKNNFVGARDGDQNHDDGIQVFLFNAGSGTLRRLTLRGNIIFAREQDGLPFPNPLQGIGCFDGPLIDFLVEKNVVCVNHYHGISLYDAQGCTIRDNTCFTRSQDKPRPWVMIGQKKNQARGNTVQNNLAHSFGFRADPEVKAGNNQPVTEAVFNRKLAELAALIDEKFGSLHPAAKRPRLERNAATAGAPAGPQANLLVISDWGFSPPEKRTPDQQIAARAMAAYVRQSGIAFDAVLVGGDNFKVKLWGPDDPQFGEAFESMYDAQVLRMPFYAVLGSHDYEYGAVAAELDYSRRHPDSRWKIAARWYRLDLPAAAPLVTVLMLDSDQDLLGREQWQAQLRWLEAELARPRQTAWTICLAHHPLFSDGQHGDNPAMQAALGPLLQRHKVDFYISGHDHVLEHLQVPGWQTTFLISGGGGENIKRPVPGNRGLFVRASLGFAALQCDPRAVKVSLVNAAGQALHVFERDRAGQIRILR